MPKSVSITHLKTMQVLPFDDAAARVYGPLRATGEARACRG
jgi:hypothetical protein